MTADPSSFADSSHATRDLHHVVQVPAYDSRSQAVGLNAPQPHQPQAGVGPGNFDASAWSTGAHQGCARDHTYRPAGKLRLPDSRNVFTASRDPWPLDADVDGGSFLAEISQTNAFSSMPQAQFLPQGIQQSSSEPDAAVTSSSDTEEVFYTSPQNKNCHFCEHSPKRSAIFACSAPLCGQVRCASSCVAVFWDCGWAFCNRQLQCSLCPLIAMNAPPRILSACARPDELTSTATMQMFCEKCLARHLGQPTGFTCQADATAARWRCPLCVR